MVVGTCNCWNWITGILCNVMTLTVTVDANPWLPCFAEDIPTRVAHGQCSCSNILLLYGNMELSHVDIMVKISCRSCCRMGRSYASRGGKTATTVCWISCGVAHYPRGRFVLSGVETIFKTLFFLLGVRDVDRLCYCGHVIPSTASVVDIGDGGTLV